MSRTAHVRTIILTIIKTLNNLFIYCSNYTDHPKTSRITKCHYKSNKRIYEVELKSDAVFFCHIKNTERHETNHTSKLSSMSEVHTAVSQHNHHRVQ